MPSVPIYSGPQVREQPFESAAQRAPDVSTDLNRMGQGMANLGAVIGAAAYKQQLRDDETAANTADLDVTSSWLQWDAENRKRYQGANAGDYDTAARAWWSKAAQASGENLTPSAKALVTKALARRQAASLGNVVQYVEQEKERHADNTADARVNTSIQFGVTSGDVAGAAHIVRGIAAEVGARKGWSTERVQAEQLKNLSALHLTHITKLAEVDPTAARAYYDTNKAEIGAAQQPRAEEVLKAEVDNQTATQLAAENAGLPLSEQIKKAGEIKDPQLREKTLLQMKNNYALVKQAEAEREEQFSDGAWQLFAQGKKIPELMLAGMDGRERAQLLEAQRARTDRLATKANAPVKTDTAALAVVYDMMRDDPAGFKNLRMASLVEKFSPTDIEQISRIQRDMAKPSTEKDAVTLSAQIGSYMRGMPKNDKPIFERKAHDAVIRFKEQNNDRPPNDKERQTILDGLVVEGIVEDRTLWFDAKTPRYKMTPEEEAKAFPAPKASASKASAAPVRVQTVEQAKALKPGTRFIDPAGIERIR